MDRQALVLTLADSDTIPLEVRQRIRIVLGRDGLQLITPVAVEPLTWPEILSLQDPLEAVERLERGLGLQPAPHAPHLLPARALTLSVISFMLNAGQNQPEAFHVRSLSPITLGVEDWSPTDISAFPSLEESLIEKFESSVESGSAPEAPAAWVLYKGANAVAAFDEEGGLHAHGVRFDLVNRYFDTGCSLDGTALLAMTLLVE